MFRALARWKNKETPAAYPPDFDAEARHIIESVSAFTMTSPERLFALIQATRHVVQHQIPGAMVECGVWRGGSMMASALTLKALQTTERQLFLFDTFEGMTAPGAHDRDLHGTPARVHLLREKTTEDHVWAYAPLEEVRKNLAQTGYPMQSINFVKGPVEETLKENAPENIALLRLDTDFYQSTLHELEILYPRLAPGGILILDDYGHWEGCRRAVDEYLKKNGLSLFLQRIDYTGRIAVKPR